MMARLAADEALEIVDTDRGRVLGGTRAGTTDKYVDAGGSIVEMARKRAFLI
jgi:hypothetical protein